MFILACVFLIAFVDARATSPRVGRFTSGEASARGFLQIHLKEMYQTESAEFKTAGQWGFFKGSFKKFENLKYFKKEAAEGWDVENNFFVLLKREADKWHQTAIAVGCTDVCFATWPEIFGVPKHLLGLARPPAATGNTVEALVKRVLRKQLKSDFEVESMESKKNSKWQFFTVSFKNFEALPYFKKETEEGWPIENNGFVLLKRKEDGSWFSPPRGVAVGCTDVCFEPWADHFGVPKHLLGLAPAPSSTDVDPAEEAARELLKKEVGGPYKTEDYKFKKEGAFAFFSASFKNWKSLPYFVREAQSEWGLGENNGYVLLRRTGGQWKKLAIAVSCTDVCWWGWADQFGAPKAIFK